jgi:hypothetical protein
MFDSVRSAFPDGQLELRLWPGGHLFSKEMRETAYAFLSRHLTEVYVRGPVCFILKNTVLLSVPLTSFTVPRSRRESLLT